MESRIINVDTRTGGVPTGAGSEAVSERCPRCGSEEIFALQKTSPGFNTCFKCRSCFHVFSPVD